MTPELPEQVEDIVRANGATPATVCVMDGQLCIGLSHDKLERLAKEGRSVRKVGVRDLPLVSPSAPFDSFGGSLHGGLDRYRCSRGCTRVLSFLWSPASLTEATLIQRAGRA